MLRKKITSYLIVGVVLFASIGTGTSIISNNNSNINNKVNNILLTQAVQSNGQTVVAGNNIISSAQSYAVSADKVAKMVNRTYRGSGKEVFLTFDDGPSSTYTPQILKILNDNGVHATFFVLGSSLNSSVNQNIVRQELANGNAIGNHTYTHDYSKIYPRNRVSISVFMNEFYRTKGILQNVLGKNFDSRVVRMPGGHMSRVYYHDRNLKTLDNTLNASRITSIDWNVESGDATGKPYTPSQLAQNAINQSKGNNHVVVLMHDVKKNTVQSLPSIINYYKSQGYTFKVISNS